jgi:hypothetical protein
MEDRPSEKGNPLNDEMFDDEVSDDEVSEDIYRVEDFKN